MAVTLIMAPSGRKSAAKTAKLAQEDPIVHAYDFEEHTKKHLSGSEEDVREGVVISTKCYTHFVLWHS